MNKKVAIIIPNHNGKKYLEDLFGSLKTLDYPEDSWKLIFIDDVSTDDSFEEAQKLFPQAHFIKNKKNMGFTGTNNIGAQWAIENNFDYILLLNQDTIISSNLLNVLTETMESDKKIACVQPKILLHPEIDKFNNTGNRIHFLGFGYGDSSGVKDIGQFNEPRTVNYCSGSCVMIRLDIVKQVGLFDNEMFFDLEDLDLGWKMTLMGYKNIYQPKAFIYHKYKFSENKNRFYHTEKNRFIVLLKNYKTKTLLLMLPMLLIMELGLMLFAFKNKWLSVKLKSYMFFFKPGAWKYIKSKKSEVNAIRKIDDKTILKSFSYKIDFQGVDNPLLKYIGNPIMKIYYNLVKIII